jgi:hypothetical protein
LLDNCLFFYLIYPDDNEKTKNIFITRFKERGSPESFVKLISDNWETWINECSFCSVGCKNIRMVFPNLENELNHIITSENGDSK